jgi:hypothetical protein
MQPTTRRLALGGCFAALVALAACGGSSSPDKAATTSTPPTTVASSAACADVFADGKVVTDEQWKAGCTNDQGAPVVAFSYSYDCGTAYTNALGWGYGGKPFHAGATLPGLEVISQCGES